MAHFSKQSSIPSDEEPASDYNSEEFNADSQNDSSTGKKEEAEGCSNYVMNLVDIFEEKPFLVQPLDLCLQQPLLAPLTVELFSDSELLYSMRGSKAAVWDE